MDTLYYSNILLKKPFLEEVIKLLQVKQILLFFSEIICVIHMIKSVLLE
jgi:hypothetical protein